MVARQDPDRYAAQLLREKRKAGKAGAIMRHQQNLESYREKRLQLAAVSGKKPDPYDEFTVFGQPSGPVVGEPPYGLLEGSGRVGGKRGAKIWG